MSNSVALNVLHAISFASVVGSTKTNIAVAPTTSVCDPVAFVEMILAYAVYGTISYLYLSCVYIGQAHAKLAPQTPSIPIFTGNHTRNAQNSFCREMRG